MMRPSASRDPNFDNIFNISIKLSVLCEGDYVLIIIENNCDLQVRISRPQKLIKKIF